MLRKRYDGIAWRQKRSLLGKRGAIPRGLRGWDVETPAAGEAQLDGGKRSISRIAQLVFGVNVNPWIRPWRKLDTNFLTLDGIPRPERDRARRDPKANRSEKKTKERAGMRAWQQSESIVAGEIGRSKRDGAVPARGSTGWLSAVCGLLRGRTKCPCDCGRFRGRGFLFPPVRRSFRR